MNQDKLYNILASRMHEMAVVPPQTVGPFTSVYKRLVPALKFHPWRMGIAVSFIFSILLYLIFGVRVVRLVSLLSFGF